MSAAVPEEFVAVGPGVLVRRGYEDEVWRWLDAPDGAAEAIAGGRGAARAIALRDGGRAGRRGYSRGGLLRGLLGDVYWDRPPRAWRELAVTEAARRSGVVAPEVLAAAARPLAPPFCWLHRGILVTRELAQRRSLAAALRAAATAEERRAWIAGAWRTAQRLHAAGIRHPDLNATNLLVGGPEDPVAVIDFDRAVAGSRPVGALGRAMARRRLARSIAKLGLPDLDRAGAAAIVYEAAGRGVR